MTFGWRCLGVARACSTRGARVSILTAGRMHFCDHAVSIHLRFRFRFDEPLVVYSFLSMPSKHFRVYIILTALLASVGLLLLSFHDAISEIKSLKHLQELAGNRLGKPHRTALEIDPPPDERPYGAVVIASGADTDSRWTASVEAKFVHLIVKLSISILTEQKLDDIRVRHTQAEP